MPSGKWVVTKQMKKLINKNIFLTLLCWVMATTVSAQLKGVVIDSHTGETVVSPTVSYKDQKITVVGNLDGRFSIERHDGWQITISAVGYKPLTVKIKSDTPDEQVYKLKSDTRKLDEVVVKSKKKRKYSRKNNPAVELMKRVIAAKKQTHLENYDYYQYNKYQKITLAVNDISPDDIENESMSKRQWLLDQIEVCSWNDKLILPLTVDETVSKHLYRKSPRSEKDIVLAMVLTNSLRLAKL